MAQNMGVESIVARFMAGMILAVEQVECDYCASGSWAIQTIELNSRTGGADGFDLFCSVICNDCQGVSSRKWPFNPYTKVVR